MRGEPSNILTMSCKIHQHDCGIVKSASNGARCFFNVEKLRKKSIRESRYYLLDCRRLLTTLSVKMAKYARRHRLALRRKENLFSVLWQTACPTHCLETTWAIPKRAKSCGLYFQRVLFYKLCGMRVGWSWPHVCE